MIEQRSSKQIRQGVAGIMTGIKSYYSGNGAGADVCVKSDQNGVQEMPEIISAATRL